MLLSQSISATRKQPAWPAMMAADSAQLAGARLFEARPDLGPVAVNFGALMWLWWHSGRRLLWQIQPATAQIVRATGITFIPEDAPFSWLGGCLLAEAKSADDELAAGCHSLAGYWLPNTESGRPYLWIFALGIGGGTWAWGLPAAAGDLAGAAKGMPPLISESMIPAKYSAQSRSKAIEAAQFLLSLGCYIERPGDGWKIGSAGDGPPMRNEKGKAIKKAGKVQSLWSYGRLNMEPSRFGAKAGDPRGPLDKDGLSLRPTVVRPYWRRAGKEKLPILVAAHLAHRWAKPAEMKKI